MSVRKFPYITQYRFGVPKGKGRGRGTSDLIPGPHGMYKFSYDFDEVAPYPVHTGDELQRQFAEMIEDAVDVMRGDAERFAVPHPFADLTDVDRYIMGAWFIFHVEFTNERFPDGMPDWSQKRETSVQPRAFAISIEKMARMGYDVLRDNGDYENVEMVLTAGGIDSEMLFVRFLRADLYFSTAPFKDPAGRYMLSSFAEQYFRRGSDRIKLDRLQEQERLKEQRAQVEREYQENIERMLRENAEAFERIEEESARFLRRSVAARKGAATRARNKEAKAAQKAKRSEAARKGAATRKARKGR